MTRSRSSTAHQRARCSSGRRESPHCPRSSRARRRTASAAAMLRLYVQALLHVIMVPGAVPERGCHPVCACLDEGEHLGNRGAGLIALGEGEGLGNRVGVKRRRAIPWYVRARASALSRAAHAPHACRQTRAAMPTLHYAHTPCAELRANQRGGVQYEFYKQRPHKQHRLR